MRTKMKDSLRKALLGAGLSLVVLAYPIVVKAAPSISKAKDFYKKGRYVKAAATMEKVIESEQENIEAHRFLAKCYVRAGRVDDAEIKYVGLMARNPKNALYRYMNAYLYDLKGYDKFLSFSNERRAMIGYKRAAALDPEFPYIHYSMGLMLYKQKKYPDAIEALKKEIAINNKNEKAHYYLGLSYYQERKFNKAINAGLDMLKIFPKSERANDLIGKGHYALGNKKKAMAAWKKALKLTKKDLAAGEYNINGLIYLGKKLFNTAAKEFRIGLRKDPKNARMHTNLGITYYEKVTAPTYGDHPEKWLYEAIKEYKKAIALDPKDPEAYLKMSESQSRLGLNDDWIATLQTYVKLFPQDLKGYNELGNAYKQIGLYKEAIDILKKGLTVDRNNAEIYRNLGYVYYYKGFQQRAQESWEKSVKLYPNQPLLKKRIKEGFSKK